MYKLQPHKPNLWLQWNVKIMDVGVEHAGFDKLREAEMVTKGNVRGRKRERERKTWIDSQTGGQVRQTVR